MELKGDREGCDGELSRMIVLESHVYWPKMQKTGWVEVLALTAVLRDVGGWGVTVWRQECVSRKQSRKWPRTHQRCHLRRSTTMGNVQPSPIGALLLAVRIRGIHGGYGGVRRRSMRRLVVNRQGAVSCSDQNEETNDGERKTRMKACGYARCVYDASDRLSNVVL